LRRSAAERVEAEKARTSTRRKTGYRKGTHSYSPRRGIEREKGVSSHGKLKELSRGRRKLNPCALVGDRKNFNFPKKIPKGERKGERSERKTAHSRDVPRHPRRRKGTEGKNSLNREKAFSVAKGSKERGERRGAIFRKKRRCSNRKEKAPAMVHGAFHAIKKIAKGTTYSRQRGKMARAETWLGATLYITTEERYEEGENALKRYGGAKRGFVDPGGRIRITQVAKESEALENCLKT